MMSAVQAWFSRVLRLDARAEDRRREREETDAVRHTAATRREAARRSIHEGARTIEEATGNPIRDMLSGSYREDDRRTVRW